MVLSETLRLNRCLPGLVRLSGTEEAYLILETKGFDPAADIKTAAALRWVSAVNQDGKCGRWAYKVVRKPSEVVDRVNEALAELRS